VAHEQTSTIARLRGLLEVTRLIRGDEDLPALLAAIGRTVAESLGFGTVVINLYRPAWDDFSVTTVQGHEDARAALLGVSRSHAEWEPLLDDRFLRRGAYFVAHELIDWDDATPSYVPPLRPSDDPNAWHAEDALLVPMLHTAGHILGIVSVDEPVSGMRPSDDDLDVLVAVAEHAAIAVQGAQEAAVAARHRRALEQLLAVSSQLAASPTIDAILPAVGQAIRDALGFQNVSIELLDPATGRFATQATVGWEPGDRVLELAMTLAEIEPLLDSAYEIEGCYLLPPDEAKRLLKPSQVVYSSSHNGRGAAAWQNHWLLVPLRDRRGAVIGVIWADEPEDRLLPSIEKLQALRVFANQAAAAILSAGQVQELRFFADHDPLTRLLNRRAFMRRLDSEVARSIRYARAFSLVICDLDGFKSLNDRYGHAAGDEALRMLGQILCEALRRPDDAFRIGGDEFALLLAEASDADAIEVVERVSVLLTRSDDERLAGVGASFGVAACPEHAADSQTLFRLADEALYAAKRAGSQVQFAA
jgi:diguanylate cyclase (GGDEF)-like protein